MQGTQENLLQEKINSKTVKFWKSFLLFSLLEVDFTAIYFEKKCTFA